jgi:hydrogenase nickel incorporation protein HypA/HybF
MHELSISSAIVDTALRHAGGRRVRAVNVRIGALRQVVPDSLAFYFEIVARDTLCEGATLDLGPVRALLRCGACDRRWDPAPEPAFDGVLVPAFRCPGCGAPAAETVAGDELEVESIEVEDAPSGVVSG